MRRPREAAAPNRRNGKPNGRGYELTADPIFFATVGVFATLTTLLPAALGQATLLPLLQSLALSIFVAIPLRRGQVDKGIVVVAVWLALQLLIMAFGSAMLPRLFERSIQDGFNIHRALLEWSVTGRELPGWLAAEPGARGAEIAGAVLGSLASAGAAGNWFLMRAVNLFGYSAGRLAAHGLSGALLGLMPWRLATIAGEAGMVLLLAQPLLRNRWSPAFYTARQRRLAAVSAALIVLGLLMELALPPLWQRWWGL